MSLTEGSADVTDEAAAGVITACYMSACITSAYRSEWERRKDTARTQPIAKRAVQSASARAPSRSMIVTDEMSVYAGRPIIASKIR